MLRAGDFKRILTTALVVFGSSAAFAADGGVWSVSKSSGEVWIATPGAAQVSLGGEEVLNPGDTIRTGHNGRVLLQRGAETMLIKPNSVVGLPNEATDGMATTILQRAGSILLDVEKRNVKHFEVETPYLAAVVKGTQFRVTINAGSTKVEVTRGQVEVSDFKTGEIAQVMPGQAATAFAAGQAGLSLSGSGTFNPIEHGSPRASTIDRVPVPKDGLHAPRNAGSGSSIHALSKIGAPGAETAAAASHEQHRGTAAATTRANVVHLSTTLGEVKLNVSKASHGLAHGATLAGVRNAPGKDTIWSDAKVSANSNGNTATANANGSSAAATNGSAASTASAAVTAAIGAANASNSGNGNGDSGSGNGATGNGKGKGNANSNAGGNGNGHGNGNGNGNGNGDSGENNGNGNGKGKKS